MARRLLLLINSLAGGGAEKVMLELAGMFQRTCPGVDVTLATLDALPSDYPVPEGLETIRLDSRGSPFRSVLETRRLIRSLQPDVVLSFLTRANCAAILARRTGHFRCVISERVNTTSHLGDSWKGRIWRKSVAVLYPIADAVVAVSQGVGDELLHRYGVAEGKLTVIGNPVDIDTLGSRSQEPAEIPLPTDFLLSVGRLVPNKGGEVLLRAFAEHKNRRRSLVMLGDGPERDKLVSLAHLLGISDRVHMAGHVQNPQAIMRRAAAYVSASRSEGFPNALVEAMAVGCPVAVTDCPSGPAEILRGEDGRCAATMEPARWGVLVPMDDVKNLAAAMDFLDDANHRKAYAELAHQRARHFAAASIAENYARVLNL